MMSRRYETKTTPSEIYKRLEVEWNRVIVDLVPNGRPKGMPNGRRAEDFDHIVFLDLNGQRSWNNPPEIHDGREIVKELFPRKITIYGDGYSHRDKQDPDGKRWRELYARLKDLVARFESFGYEITRVKAGLDCISRHEGIVAWNGEFELPARGTENTLETFDLDEEVLERLRIDYRIVSKSFG